MKAIECLLLQHQEMPKLCQYILTVQRVYYSKYVVLMNVVSIILLHCPHNIFPGLNIEVGNRLIQILPRKPATSALHLNAHSLQINLRLISTALDGIDMVKSVKCTATAIENTSFRCSCENLIICKVLCNHPVGADPKSSSFTTRHFVHH